MKRLENRLIAIALVIVLVVTMVQVAPRGNNASVTYAAETIGARTRGVVYNLEDLPQYNDPNNMAKARGTADRPFVILEVVPYEEYAEFGYLISGCEPVDIQKMCLTGDISGLPYMGNITVNARGETYFFPDEEEFTSLQVYMGTLGADHAGDITLVDSGVSQVNGYYELVELGTGTYQYTLTPVYDPTVSGGDVSGGNASSSVSDGNLILGYEVTIEKAEGGNLVWHSLSANQITGITFLTEDQYSEEGALLTNMGDRLYTQRQVETGEQLLHLAHYYDYMNNDTFLTHTLQMTPEEAENYSIVIKTITPAELNNSPAWIDYSDLVILSPRAHLNAYDNWAKYNWRGKAASTNRVNVDNAFETQGMDISWEVALKLFYKVNADTDYAAVVVDDAIYNTNHRGLAVKVFDWNLRDTGATTPEMAVSNNNFYKLMVMLLSMDSNLFKQLYLSGDNPIIQGGRDTLQTGDAATYWGFHTFLLVPPNRQDITGNLWAYWTDPERWDAYNIDLNITTRKNYVNDHVFSYTNGNTMLLNYETIDLSGGNSENYAKNYGDFADYLTDEQRAHPTPSDAVRYILGIGKGNDYSYLPSIKILDLEPSVGLKYDSTVDRNKEPDKVCPPDWYLTPTYIRMLVPQYRGSVEIVHQTTAEFISRTEDLNSEYQMIFMGLDIGAYRTVNTDVQLNNGTWVKLNLPDWKDTATIGHRIYTHTGDKLISTEYYDYGGNQQRSVKWIWNGTDRYDSTANSIDSKEIRLTGNDISRIKLKELQDFVNAGYPIIAEGYLYDLEKALIDEQSYIYQFVNWAKKNGKSVYSTDNLAAVDNAVSKITNAVSFIQCPKPYSGETVNENSAVFTNQNSYLDTESGRAYMDFRFTVQDSGYKYRIYVDQDRNFKFEDNEIILSGDANPSTDNYIHYRIAASMVGVVQWKIEVYRADNASIRYVETGTSAVRNNTGVKKEINVLQIMPRNGNFAGALNLQQNERFRYFSQDLPDFKITIRSITLDEFQSYFRGADFSYDQSQPTDGVNNPRNLDRLGKVDGTVSLSEYNMIIIGFGDKYGDMDFSNYNGEVDYLKYYADQGKSILFTHDLTSMSVRALPENSDGYRYGATANILLRDLMGMNRYKVVSSTINKMYSKAERDELVAYQNQQEAEVHAAEGNAYDWLTSPRVYAYDWLGGSTPATHGFTYFAAKRIAGTGVRVNNYYDNPNLNTARANKSWDSPIYDDENNVIYRMPYKYMIQYPNGRYAHNNDDVARYTALIDSNDLTTRVSRLNEGQITVYPYEIGDNIEVATTHGQWFQLNPEDEDVTVWYTLAPDKYVVREGSSGDGSSITYQVSPNDGMNNYYIYSKGNIFYSGVGHSTNGGNLPDMETKLFINTMIAAYSSSYEPPVVDVLNDEAVFDGAQNYSIELLQNFDRVETIGTSTYYANSSTFNASDTYTIQISPTDFNVVTTKLQLTVYVDDGDPATPAKQINVLKDAAGNNVRVEGGAFIVENGKVYTFDYSLSDFLAGARTIQLNIKNDRVTADNTTTINMSVQPLFPLD